MRKRAASCPFCHALVPAKSVFCSRCGQRLAGDSADAESILLASRRWEDGLGAVVDACNSFLRQWPDRPETRDVRLTLEAGLWLAKLAGRGAFDWTHRSTAELEQACRAGVAPRLANGVLATTRVADARGRKRIETALGRFRSVESATLVEQFDEAAAETVRLMPDGKIPALAQGLTYDQAMRDAVMYADSIDKGDLEDAEKGFRYLKSMHPKSFVFRTMLATALARQGRIREALRESLYGYSLGPDELQSTVDLARLLAGLQLHCAAYELIRHFHRLCPDVQDERLHGLEALTHAVASVALAQASGCQGGVADSAAPDALAAMDVVPRPWLTSPPELPKAPLDHARVFISYRRLGSPDLADRLQRKLKARHPAMHAFRDQTHLDAGDDFVARLADEVDGCDLVVALIDRDWAATLTNDPGCVIAREIGRALEHARPIVPVLIGDTPMPQDSELPPFLAGFWRRNAVRWDPNAFEAGFEELEAEAAKAVAHTQQRQDKAMAELDAEIEEMAQEPTAAHPLIDALRASVDQVLVAGEVHGIGIPRGLVALEGDWECRSKVPSLDATGYVHFTTRSGPQTFTGRTWASPDKGWMKHWHMQRAEIHGTWKPVVDATQDLLLGIKLDGLNDKDHLVDIAIPMHRRVGDEFVGESPEGIVWISQLVRPASRDL